MTFFSLHAIFLLRRLTANEDAHTHTRAHAQPSRRNDSPAPGRGHQCRHRGRAEAAGMRPGPAHRGPAGHHCGRGRALALWDPAPRPPDASRDPSSPLGLMGVLALHMYPGSRLVLPAGPSQSPTSDHRRRPLRWRWRPLGRGDGDIPGELPWRFPHAVPECDRVLRLPTQLPLPRGHGGSAQQDPSLPDPVSHASQMRGCPSGRSATLREGRPLLPDGNVAALSLVRG